MDHGIAQQVGLFGEVAGGSSARMETCERPPPPARVLDPARLHRVHAAPAEGKGGRSFDLGPFRWRPEGSVEGAGELARAMAHRLALCWNLCEGIPTATLHEGGLPAEAEAVQALLEELEARPAGPDVMALVARVRAAGDDLRLDDTDGRPADCDACYPRGDAAFEEAP